MKKYWAGIAAVAVLIVALVMHLLVENGVFNFNQTHNYWFFIFALIGIGVVLVVRAFATNNRNNLMLVAFGMIAVGLAFIFAAYTKTAVHTVLLILAVLGSLFLLIGVILGANNPQNVAKNDQPGYKNYFERKKEEEAQEKEEKPLPEVKSFEDVNKKDGKEEK